MKKWVIILLSATSLVFAEKPTLNGISAPTNSSWERIPSPDNGYDKFYRMRVPHGWLVYTHQSYDDSTTIFIADENHEWAIPSS